MNTELMFSSKTEEWYTPLDFFQKLDAEFHFNLDPCATDDNHKCKRYFTREIDGLRQSWGGYKVFCNPPYGKVIGEWVKKAYEENQKPNTLVVMLLPARTDTKWFHSYIYGKAEIRFVKGRLKFGGCNNAAPFPSMVVIYKERKEMIQGQQISLFDYDYMQEESKPEYPPIIEELDKDLTLLFVGLITRDKSYEVWDHVPNLGKRYKLWVDVREEDTVKDISLEPIIEKYKAKQLEVSISSTGSLKDGISHSLMISTMWLTNGHKEVWND